MSVHVAWVLVADDSRAVIYSVPRGMARLREVLELGRSGETRDFAAKVAGYLEDAGATGRYDELVLVAAPEFLNALRAELGGIARGALVGAIGKDLVSAGREILQEEVLRVL